MRVTTIRTILADDCRGHHAWKHAAAIAKVRSAIVEALGQDDGEEVLAFALGEIEKPDWNRDECEQWCSETFGQGLVVTDDKGRKGRAFWDEGAIVWEHSEESAYDVCGCCLQIIANGSTHGGCSAEEEAESIAAIAKESVHGALVALSDCGDESAQEEFSHSTCDLCGALPGARYAVAIIEK